MNWSSDAANSDEPIHVAFALTRSSYFVLPRLAMQQMPQQWQARFVRLMMEMEEIIPETPAYTVQRRDQRGRLIKGDPWANYRRGTVSEAQDFDAQLMASVP